MDHTDHVHMKSFRLYIPHCPQCGSHKIRFSGKTGALIFSYCSTFHLYCNRHLLRLQGLWTSLDGVISQEVEVFMSLGKWSGMILLGATVTILTSCSAVSVEERSRQTDCPDMVSCKVYMKLYQERVKLLGLLATELEHQCKAGMDHPCKFLNARFAHDQARLRLAHLRINGTAVSAGFAEAVMEEKFRREVSRQLKEEYEAGNATFEKYMQARLALNQAELNLARQEYRIISNPEFQKAAECLKNYPQKSPSDEEIKALAVAEKAF